MKKRGMSGKSIFFLVLATAVLTSVFWFFIGIRNSEPGFDLEIIFISGETFWDPARNVSCVGVERGDDDVELVKLQVIFSIKGNSKSFFVLLEEGDLIAPDESKVYCFDLTGYGKPDSVKIAPIILDGGEEKTGVVSGKMNDIVEGIFSDVAVYD